MLPVQYFIAMWLEFPLQMLATLLAGIGFGAGWVIMCQTIWGNNGE
jgi:hypothetical protein